MTPLRRRGRPGLQAKGAGLGLRPASKNNTREGQARANKIRPTSKAIKGGYKARATSCAAAKSRIHLAMHWAHGITCDDVHKQGPGKHGKHKRFIDNVPLGSRSLLEAVPGKDVVEAEMFHAVRHVQHILRRDLLGWGPQPVLKVRVWSWSKNQYRKPITNIS